MRIHCALVLAVAAAVLAFAVPAQGAITVANHNDSGPGSLREAVATAPSGETIVLPAGTYTLASTLQIGKAVTISGHAAADTTIRAGGPFTVIKLSGAFDATISGVTIRDGSPVGEIVFGGGVYSGSANLTLRGVSLTHNSANANGATGKAGGLAFGGAIFSQANLTVIDSSVTENSATANGASAKKGGSAFGGGIFSQGSLTMVSSTVSGNSALASGGSGPANAEQNGGTAFGGGVFSQHSSTPAGSIADVTVSGNVADASGGPGGGGGTAFGGGLFEQVVGAPATLTKMTIASNVARAAGASAGTAQGGGVFAQAGEPGSIAFLSVTAAGNRVEPASASGGGGNLLVEGPSTIGNSIVSGGSGPAGSENCKGVATSLGFNLESLDQCGLHTTGDQVKTDPLLGPLQDNGGLTQTMLPAANSPAVDQGSAFGLTADQRGVTRPIDFPSIATPPGGDGSDIGAAELQPSGAITLGKLKKNKKKGTATLTVTLPVPSAGTLVLKGKGLKKQTKAIGGQASVKLKIATKGGAAKSLRKKGKRKVKLEVSYTPAGTATTTRTRSATLKRKVKKNR